MKKTASIASALAVVFSFAAPALAASFNPGPELNRSACANVTGAPIVSVVQKIKNDADSGVGGNTWAFDAYTRNIQVFRTAAPDVFCGITRYKGSFVTNAGRSPGNTGTLPAGIRGEFYGGYRTTEFTAAFKGESSLKPRFGDLGVFDYQCNTDPSCPGHQSWTDWYFNDVSGFDLAWWGWKYMSEKGHDVWINSIDGNSGDILQ